MAKVNAARRGNDVPDPERIVVEIAVHDPIERLARDVQDRGAAGSDTYGRQEDAQLRADVCKGSVRLAIAAELDVNRGRHLASLRQNVEEVGRLRLPRRAEREEVVRRACDETARRRPVLTELAILDLSAF